MNMVLIFVLSGLASYLTGAIPFAYIVARAKGVDIRKVGSGNVGATNVLRSVGKGWGILTFACDVLKGFVPSFAFPRVVAEFLPATSAPPALALVCACLSVAGHIWPVYLRFRGGKGVATSAGALLGITPPVTGAAFAVWLVVFALTRYVSAASIAAALAMAAAGWSLLRGDGMLLPAILTGLAAAVIWRHRGNIGRLVNGTEHRVEFGRKK